MTTVILICACFAAAAGLVTALAFPANNEPSGKSFALIPISAAVNLVVVLIAARHAGLINAIYLIGALFLVHVPALIVGIFAGHAIRSFIEKSK